MQNYRTVKDKSAEWGLSARHVQYLCRCGKIDGAVKRAEVWFIPAGTPSPAVKTKLGGMGFAFVGTKKRVFLCAIDLFMREGYDRVSLRDIARQVGIRQSTIYNHFKSKQEILDTIYDFYSHHYVKDRPSLEEMADMLKTHSPVEFICALHYDFDKEYVMEMAYITRIVYQRLGVDARAREIGKTLMMDSGTQFVEEVLNSAVAAGRFEPFNTHLMAVFVNSIRMFTLYNWIVDPENMAQVLADEQALYQAAPGLMDALRTVERPTGAE